MVAESPNSSQDPSRPADPSLGDPWTPPPSVYPSAPPAYSDERSPLTDAFDVQPSPDSVTLRFPAAVDPAAPQASAWAATPPAPQSGAPQPAVTQPTVAQPTVSESLGIPPTADGRSQTPLLDALLASGSMPPLAATPEPEPVKKRGWGKKALAGVGILALVGGGIFAGTQLGEDDGATATTAADECVVDCVDETPATGATAVDSATESGSTGTGSATSTGAALATEDATTADEPTDQPIIATPILSTDDVEPVVAVADAVGPSVVRIDDGLGGLGSGIVYSAEGYIVTNAHVVGQSTEVLVTLSDGFSAIGQVLGADTETDVAVVQVPSDVELTPAVFASPETVQVGQLAVAIGSPFGLSQTVTAGIVSSNRRPVAAEQIEGVNTTVPMIQTDAPINPGNSGGALVDKEGRVVGMNTLIRTSSQGTGNIGVGFAIVSDIVQKVADGIIAGTPVQPSVLGVSGSNPTAGQEPGAVITEVDLGGAAAIAGLLAGDRVVQFAGVDILSMGDLAAVVRLSDAGVPIPMQIVREGQVQTVLVELQTR